MSKCAVNVESLGKIMLQQRLKEGQIYTKETVSFVRDNSRANIYVARFRRSRKIYAKYAASLNICFHPIIWLHPS